MFRTNLSQEKDADLDISEFFDIDTAAALLNDLSAGVYVPNGEPYWNHRIPDVFPKRQQCDNSIDVISHVLQHEAIDSMHAPDSNGPSSASKLLSV